MRGFTVCIKKSSFLQSCLQRSLECRRTIESVTGKFDVERRDRDHDHAVLTAAGNEILRDRDHDHAVLTAAGNEILRDRDHDHAVLTAAGNEILRERFNVKHDDTNCK